MEFTFHLPFTSCLALGSQLASMCISITVMKMGIMFYKPQNYEKHGLKAEDLIERHHLSGENKTLFDETKTYYPFNEQTGYQ